jgi:predicted Zn finger-like uncharacterized protein
VLIDCPGCAASYHITKAALGPNGRRVACPRCQTVWLAAPSLPEAPGFIKATPHFSPEEEPPAKQPAYVRAIAAPLPRELRPRRMGLVGKLLASAAALMLAMGLIASRDAIARLWPGAGRLYADIGMPVGRQSLAIRELHTALTRINGEVFLGVEGVILNQRQEETAVPPIRLAILDAAGNELYTWQIAPARHALQGGDSLPFRARLAAPPADGRDVVAHFANPDEMIADR